MLRCGLLGEKLGHSYSPEIHALLGDYEYELYEKTPGEAEVFLRHGEFDGLNVTIPYKKTAAALCAQLSPVARKLGSVNTIAVRKGEDGSRALYGDNTDYAGFATLVRKSRVRVEGCKCLVLGSGGASVTVQAVLKDLGAGEVVVISRSGADNYGNLERHADADVLVNTTPVGMYPNNGQVPLDLRVFHDLKAVYDLIYNPARTALVLQAESLGIPSFGGLLMLVAQAEAASRVFTAKDPAHPDEDPLRSAAKIQAICDYLSGAQQNIALIGMPGCGKSSVAKALAELTGREVYDADEEIEKRTGKLIPEIFAEGGEEGFRAVETEVLADLGKLSGVILATGGGCVTRPENYALLRQNSRIVWIQRDLSLLAKEGRPLSMAGDINQIYVERKPKYERFADFSVVNDGTPEACAALICKELER